MHYTVVAERSGQWWSLQCLEVPDAISQVTDLADANQIVEAIEWVAGVPATHIEIDLTIN